MPQADFPFAIVGFDLDGTLLDTSGDLAASVNHVLAAEGRAPLSPAQIVPMIGGGSRSMLGQALDARGGCDLARFDNLYAMLLDHYAAHIAIETKPYPGVIDTLDALASRGVALAVVTNKIERLTETLLAATGLRARFAAVIGGDTLALAKPDRAPIDAMIARCGGGRAAFVGDSMYDIAAAQAAGIPAIAVSFGFSHQPVATLGADAVIDRFADLIPTLEALR